jgi:hypothetical protein
MWYVEGIWNWNTGEKERYEGLTEEQSRAVHQTMFASGFSMIRSGKMS